MKIGLVELPQLKVLDPTGNDWTEQNQHPLISKQILIANLEAGGFEVELFNLKNGTQQEQFGETIWKGMTLQKIAYGQLVSSIDSESCDAWGVTNNFTIYRELAGLVLRHLAKGGKPIIVGGSDVIAQPHYYFNAGATAVVTDKSGAANWAIFDYVLGQPQREELSGVLFPDGTEYRKRRHPLHPQDWFLPSISVAQACLGGGNDFADNLSESSLLPIGSAMFDLGCDRTCDFCQTPTYGSGYLRMTPERALAWAARQKEAGAKSMVSDSDQFLGRVLFPEGKQEVLDIIKGLREMNLPISWDNGIELRKATKGRGKERNPEDLEPDEELVEAMWGWDGNTGCFMAYIPAERPFVGRQAYKKLLPWQQHCQMLRAIVRAGVPTISYGFIIGLPEDNRDSFLYLEEAIKELKQELRTINPSLNFFVTPYSIIPIPGTPQEYNLKKANLLRFEDPTIRGNFWTSSVDTHHLTYDQVSDWQLHLFRSLGDNWTTDAMPLGRTSPR
ncbi:radical SAM protein [Cylindrospermopsis raciborskii CENA303]|uniref:Radical SAM protein n=1 Tax=Cylindrospermopsis raciborskii CENA303 TaxID=1170769 RepID=A0A1X4GAN6_9CYAN|nr:radical SAM protein [Cylindrospermopsis raciborskii]OSO94229.1 radical SAM protein [Cylindrospermopsis raciborskii CENA303]